VTEVRVLVVDDQELVREGIASLLGVQPGITVVGTAPDGGKAVEAALSLAPDVVLMDVRMPVMDGVEAVAVLRRRSPACRVIMLTTFDDEEYVVQALQAGASGYLLKAAPEAELLAGIRAVAAGEVALAPSVSRVLVRQAAKPAPAVTLTPRELDVLRLVAEGLSNREIGERLHLGEAPVTTHRHTAFPPLAANPRTGAGTRARELGLRGG
jgi:DNA-binding NarL/FixJ family response regulator